MRPYTDRLRPCKADRRRACAGPHSTITMSEISTLEFLDAVYPEPFAELAPAAGGAPPRLVIWTMPRQGAGARSHWTDSPAEAAGVAARYREAGHVFFNVALQDEAAALEWARRSRPNAELPSVRGRVASAAVLTAVWVDLDFAGATHSSDSLPQDLDQALGLLEGVPQPPTCMVSTGGGVHVYWFMDDPWVIASEDDRAAAGSLVQRVQGAVRQRAAELGLSVDATADLARALRLPGTFNHKTLVPRPAEVLYLAPAGERRYDPSDFDLLEALDGGQPAVAPPTRPPGQPQDYWPPAYFVSIWLGCSFIRFCHHHQKTLKYDWWFAMLTIVARTWAPGSTGDEICHKMSRRYPKYTRAETTAKISQATGPGSGPYPCAKLADMGAKEEHCSRCPHRGTIKGPLVLGRRRNPLTPLAPLSRPPVTPARERGEKDGFRPDCRASSPPAAPSSNGGAPSNGGGSNGGGRVQIVLSTREKEVADQALATLAEREPNLFRRGGALVQVVADGEAANRPLHRPAEAPAARQVLDARMRELLATHCEFVRVREVKGRVDLRPAHPPTWASRALVHRFEWPLLPRLEGLVEGPVLLADGSVLQKPGYDPGSGLFLAPAIRFEPVPERPTKGQTEEALLRLRQAVCDFPFAGDAHFSAWLAALLTPLARFAFTGPAPVNLIDANVRGAGKSLLADVCHVIVTGRPAARMPYTRDEAELRKAITAIALKARQLAVIDNVSGAFGSPTLDLAFTTTSWADRLLGQNLDLELPLAVTWYVTGNNIELRGDMPRRCLHIRLETPLEKPEHRSGFRHPRLLEWLAKERSRLLPAALTLLAAYRAKERPAPKLRPWGSFEGWSDLIRGTLTWLGLKDPAETCDRLESTADAASSTRRRLLQGLDELLAARGEPATVHQILAALETHDSRVRFEVLCTALAEAFPRLKAGELPTPVQLGSKLRSLRGRVIDGRCAVPLEKTRTGLVWAVERRG